MQEINRSAGLDSRDWRNELIDEKEVADILQVSVGTLRNWRWKRNGPKWQRIGKRLVRYTRQDVSDFIVEGGQHDIA